MSTLVHHVSRSVIDPNASERDRSIFPRFDNLRSAVLLSICEAIKLGGKNANGAGCPVGGLAGFTLSRKVCDGADEEVGNFVPTPSAVGPTGEETGAATGEEGATAGAGTFVWEISGVEAFADVGEVVA
jgi:hypothetical protein